MKEMYFQKKHLLFLIFISFITCFGFLPRNAQTGENLLLKQGLWEGSPQVSFEVNSHGDIINFTLAEMVGLSECRITIDKIKIGEENYFGVKQYIQEKDYWLDRGLSKDERKIKKEEAKKTYGYWPETIMKGETIMVESLRLTGKFNTSSSIAGNYIILSCDGQQFFHRKDIYETGKTWTAKWKNK